MTPPIRILMVSDVSPLTIRGGAERVLWEEARRLAQRGHRIRLACRQLSPDAPLAMELDGVFIHHFPHDRRSPWHALTSAIRQARDAVEHLLAEEPCDVLYLHQPLAGRGALAVPAARQVPCLYNFLSPSPLEYSSRTGMTSLHHGGLRGRGTQALLWWIERACLGSAEKIRVLSRFSADQLWRLYRITADRLELIPGAADLDRFHPAANREALRRRLHLPLDRPLLFSVRNLEARMGLDTLIRALACLRQSIPEFLLTIGGTGSRREELEELARSLGLRDHVRFLGYLPDSDLPSYYQASDLFVLPTRELEGFGLIAVESLACGTPVLGTPVGAIPEILRPLDPSLLMGAATPEAMAESLSALLLRMREKPDDWARLRADCRRYAESHYGWEAAVSRLEATLFRLKDGIGSAPVPGSPCPGCGGTAWIPAPAFAGSNYWRCPEYGMGRRGEIPDASTLREIYETDYPRHFDPAQIAPVRSRLFETLLDRMQTLQSPGRLLDVGCGGGQFVRAACDRGWRAMGMDLSRQACVAADRIGIIATQAAAQAVPFQSGRMQAVSLVNVLDHTADPLPVLLEAYRVLCTEGLLVIRVPNAAFHRPCLRFLTALGPLARLRGWDRKPIHHLFPMTPGSLASMVSLAGFRVLAMRNSLAAIEGDGPRGEGSFLSGPTAQRLLVGLAVILCWVSAGHCLRGPSIELYAQRPTSPNGEAG
jgi:glycosyltransferase involved in cell wall biosynthesis/SAM-dependent methyltransferase